MSRNLTYLIGGLLALIGLYVLIRLFGGWLGLVLILVGVLWLVIGRKRNTPLKKPIAVTVAGVLVIAGWYAMSPDAGIPSLGGVIKPTGASKAGRVSGQVVKVVDGDTIDVSIGGKTERVRLLLIDTPETVDPKRPVQPFGPEASAFTKETLEGKEVTLEKDVSDQDKYGRRLFYVYVGEQMVNKLLLERGLARVAVYPPDVKYVDEFRAIQKKAQQAGKGIWSIENYVRQDGYHEDAASGNKSGKPEPTASPSPVPSKAPAASAKATSSPSSSPKEGKPPTPKASGAPVAEATPKSSPSPEDSGGVTYTSCAEARAAGAAPLRKGDPGYSLKLDGNKDGVACE